MLCYQILKMQPSFQFEKDQNAIRMELNEFLKQCFFSQQLGVRVVIICANQLSFNYSHLKDIFANQPMTIIGDENIMPAERTMGGCYFKICYANDISEALSAIDKCIIKAYGLCETNGLASETIGKIKGILELRGQGLNEQLLMQNAYNEQNAKKLSQLWDNTENTEVPDVRLIVILPAICFHDFENNYFPKQLQNVVRTCSSQELLEIIKKISHLLSPEKSEDMFNTLIDGDFKMFMNWELNQYKILDIDKKIENDPKHILAEGFNVATNNNQPHIDHEMKESITKTCNEPNNEQDYQSKTKSQNRNDTDFYEKDNGSNDYNIGRSR